MNDETHTWERSTRRVDNRDGKGEGTHSEGRYGNTKIPTGRIINVRVRVRLLFISEEKHEGRIEGHYLIECKSENRNNH